MKDITKILSSLGLLDSEIKTYLESLKHGPSSVVELSQYTKLSRQGVYTAIQQLTDRGLMSSTLHGKKQLYTAEEPQKLLAYAKRKEKEMEERIEDLKAALPDLELQSGGEKPTVKYFEGKEGIRAIMEDMSITKAPLLFEIADLDAMKRILSQQDLSPLKQKHVKKKRKVNAFYAGEYKKSGVNTTLYPLKGKDQENFNSSITVYGNKIAMITFENNMHSILIESQSLADTLRVLFNLAKNSS